MSSRKVEDLHLNLLNQLISDSGLECIRSAPESLESSSVTGESEEQGREEVEEEAASEAKVEEEHKPSSEEESEEYPDVFPTPSLRRVLPDRVRKIEEYNRIHVLPNEFRTDIDPQAIPKIAATAQQKYIEILGEIVGCKEYKNSLAEYWFLDTLANLLWRAQDDELDRPTQAVLIQWFCEWMKEMQYFDAADRLRMMRRFKDNMLAAASFIADEQRLPTPLEAGVHYTATEEMNAQSVAAGQGPEPKSDLAAQSTLAGSPAGLAAPSAYASRFAGMATQSTMDPKHWVTFEGAAYECSLRDLTKIIHYIFDLFSTDYQYDLVRSVFTFSPEYVLIDAPYQMQNPRRLYAPLKVKPKKESKSPKEGGKGKKGKKPEVLTEEYIALMQLRVRDIKQHEEEQDRDREEYNRRSTILPLVQACDNSFFDKYWPPPPPEPEPEPDPEPMRKGKKGKK